MSNCRSCGAEIIWAEHAVSGKRMPLDIGEQTTGVRFSVYLGRAHTIKPDDFDPGHRSHFSTCPNAAKHRRRA